MTDSDKLLSEGLDLCVRARKMDALEKERAEYYVLNPHVTRSMTIPLWAEEQYQADLADWEARARSHLSKHFLAGRLDSNQRLPQVLSHHSFTGQDRSSTPEVRHPGWLVPRQARDFTGPHHPPARLS